MENNQFFLHLPERPFEAIRRGTKKVEVRANKNGNSVNEMKAGDLIVFRKCGTCEEQRCTIVRIRLYPTVKELLLTEGVDQTLSSGKDLEAGIQSIESIPGYKGFISTNGVFAIVLQVMTSENILNTSFISCD